jgi:nucleoside phosphorylase
MLLVTFAVPHESRHFRRCAAAARVRLLHTGIGGAAAASALRRALEADRPGAVISSGFAGGLNANLQVGDVLADSVASSTQLLDQLPNDILRGRICPVETPADSPARKTQLHVKTGAHAVDMETDSIAAECSRAGIPLLVLRAISDAATDEIPVPLDVAWDLSAQRPRPLRILKYLACNPGRISAFTRFLRQTNLAASNLGTALDRLVPKLEAAKSVSSLG